MTNYLYSGKKKKEALMRKRMKKSKQNTENKKDIIEEENINDSKTIELTKSFGGKYDEKDKSGPIPSIFQKEPISMIEYRKYQGSVPINLKKRTELLVSKIPYDIDINPNLYHPTRQLWNYEDNKETHEKPCKDYGVNEDCGW